MVLQPRLQQAHKQSQHSHTQTHIDKRKPCAYSQDIDTADIAPYFHKTYEFIEEARTKNQGKTYVPINNNSLVRNLSLSIQGRML